MMREEPTKTQAVMLSNRNSLKRKVIHNIKSITIIIGIKGVKIINNQNSLLVNKYSNAI